MYKIYKVPLFDVVEKDGQKSFCQIQDIIAVKTPVSTYELLTGYQLKISYLKDECPSISLLDEKKMCEYGHQPTVRAYDLVNRNLALPNDLDAYMDNYDTSPWKNIYNEMKILTLAQREVIKVRVKELFRSKAKNKSKKGD